MPVPTRRADEVSAGGVVVRRTGAGWEVCLIRLGQAWSLPKGWVEPGESPEQAALREVAEETGLPAASMLLRGTLPPSDYAYRRNGRLVFKHVHHFLIETSGDAPLRPQTDELDEAAWFGLESAATKASYRDVRAALLEAQRVLATPPA
ncbi:MAG: hypothetical protein NVSMB29_04060 [Candidatus Dormibacteria bacterium]